MLKELIEKSISFTQKEKEVLVKNVDIFSDQDRVNLINVLKEEQIKITELKEDYYKKEKNIIVKYIKKVLKLGNLKKLKNIWERIKEIREKEKLEDVDVDLILDDQLNNL